MLFPGEREWRRRCAEGKKPRVAVTPTPTRPMVDIENDALEADGLDGMSLEALRDLGRQRGLSRVWGVSKAELIEAIRGA